MFSVFSIGLYQNVRIGLDCVATWQMTTSEFIFSAGKQINFAENRELDHWPLWKEKYSIQ